MQETLRSQYADIRGTRRGKGRHRRPYWVDRGGGQEDDPGIYAVKSAYKEPGYTVPLVIKYINVRSLILQLCTNLVKFVSYSLLRVNMTGGIFYFF